MSQGSIDAGGGSGVVTVTTDAECGWTASANVSWITGLTPASGQGAGRVQFQVAANPGPASRQGEITLNDQQALITQSGAACHFTLSSQTLSANASSGSGSFTVAAASGCAWTAASQAPWIQITSGAAGNGNGAIAFTIGANSGAARTGSITLADQTFQVSQASGLPNTPPCAYSLDTSALSIGASGGPGSTILHTDSDCGWTASSNVPWMILTTPASGSGTATIGVAVAANSGATRVGAISVAGLTLTVTEAGSCATSINPSSQSFGTSGGSGGPVTVTTATGCTWSTTTSDAWLTISTGASGNGNGSVTFTAAANIGPARTGTLFIAGQSFTVTEPSGCTFGISPTSQSATASGGAGTSVAVTTAAGCGWTAAANDPWLSITSGASGSGNGTTNFAIAANTGPLRAGTLTVAGQTFTVNQAAGCTFGINPTSQSIGAPGGAGTPIAVTTVSGCAWTATAIDSWLTISSGASGSGNGTVNFTAAANAGVARAGTLTVAGQTFTVNQSSGCTFGINPTSEPMAAAGGAGTPVAVTAVSGCAWTATANDSWLTVSSGASGSGNGTVNFTAAADTGPARAGTITIAGQTLTVNQASGCSFSINPTSQSAGASSGTGTSIGVTAASGCAWTSSTTDAWLTITSGASGSGNGSVGFTYAANTGPARTATLTIAGIASTVNQASGCTYSINPSSQDFPKNGGPGPTINVTTAAGCGWTATPADTWITITQGATGTGNGMVKFTVAANSGAARSSSITIGGQTFIVTQQKGN